MAKVELKQPIVDEIAGLLDGAATAVVVDYRGLTVEQDTQLRKQLREAGVTYKVYKNTLIKRAAEGTDFAALDPNLEGPTALAVSKTDATAPARILAGDQGWYCRGNLLRCQGNERNCFRSVQRSSSGQTVWQHAVPHHQLCSRPEPDRRSQRGISFLVRFCRT